MADITYKEVLSFFDKASPDMAELVYGLVGERMTAERARRQKISESLSKARKAKAKKNPQNAAQISPELAQATEEAAAAVAQSA